MGNSNNYRLICGDAKKVLPRLIEEGVKVDMVFCSPNPLFFSLKKDSPVVAQTPGNVGSEKSLQDYMNHLQVIFSEVYVLLKETGSLWVHMMDTYMLRGSMLQVPERFAMMMVEKCGWLLRGKRVWLKGPHEITKGANIFPWDWEYIYWFTQQQEDYLFNTNFPYSDTSVVNTPFEGPRKDGGSGFPLHVIRESILTTTWAGHTVLDIFMGTGETGIAALDEGRKFIGIDLFPDKVALARRRLRHYQSTREIYGDTINT